MFLWHERKCGLRRLQRWLSTKDREKEDEMYRLDGAGTLRCRSCSGVKVGGAKVRSCPGYGEATEET